LSARKKRRRKSSRASEAVTVCYNSRRSFGFMIRDKENSGPWVPEQALAEAAGAAVTYALRCCLALPDERAIAGSGMDRPPTI
jgi:hypothetical protein